MTKKRDKYLSGFIALILIILSIFFVGCNRTNNDTTNSNNLENITMPILNISGNLDGISKENTVTVEVNYKYGSQEFVENATLKYQGSSSLLYDKKNYTIKFDKKVKFVDEWGKQKKYCLKANYIDYSQARNVVSAKIYGQIAKTRVTTDDFSNLVNGGAIDGFPIVLTINNEFYGLYTLNIPKDKWLFDMNDDAEHQAILMGDDWTDTVALKSKINGNFSANVETINGMTLEYTSTEDENDYNWITTSFNNMIDFLQQDLTKKQFREEINNYINVDRAIDSMIFTQFVCGQDNCAKNILWVTFDGVVWTPSVYDLDDTWGLIYHGQDYYAYDSWKPGNSCNSNMLWKKLYENYDDEIKNRYIQLRTSVLTLENIEKTFSEFNSQIQQCVKEYETTKWKNVPSQSSNNFQQIRNWTYNRLTVFDEYFGY